MWNRFKRQRYLPMITSGRYYENARKEFLDYGERLSTTDRVIIQQVIKNRMPYPNIGVIDHPVIKKYSLTYYPEFYWMRAVDDVSRQRIIGIDGELLIITNVSKWFKLGDISVMDREFILSAKYDRKLSGFHVTCGWPKDYVVTTRKGFVYTDGDNFWFESTPALAKKKKEILLEYHDLVEELTNDKLE